MKTFVSLAIFFLILAPFSSHADQTCGFDDKHKKLLEKDPAYQANIIANEIMIRKFMKTRKPLEADEIYQIPIVVHVIHLGENIGTGTNISNDQITSTITALNEDYRKMAETHGFGNGVDVSVEFALALRDPDDQPTSGIVRVDGSAATSYAQMGIFDGNEVEIKNLSKWPNDRYYNVWIVSEIDNNNADAGTQGYAYFPGASSDYDGAVIVYNAFGTTGNLKSYTNLNRTLTHELGHAFNLYHTFEGGTCGPETDCSLEGDYCCDTPPHIGANISCGTRECSDTQQVENYMDYTGQECKNMFTACQKSRMRAALSVSRPTLLTSSALVPVGAPISDFSAITPSCAGQIAFKDKSSDGPTSWNWSFPGGNPSSSTEKNPVVTYPAGTYTVTLTTANSTGDGTTETKTDYMVVYDPPVSACQANTNDIYNDYAMGIYNVTFNTINNSTGGAVDDGGYMDFSCSHITNLVPGNSYPVEVTTGPENDEDVKIYIDYNNDGTFDKHDEIAFSSENTRTKHTGTILIPEYAVTGSVLRMRAISDFYGKTIAPCTNVEIGHEVISTEFGQAEDYGIFISALQPPVSGFKASGVNVCSGTTVNFTNLSANGSSEWTWSFPGGSPPASSDQNPAVTYDTPGTYSVTLTASNSAGTGTTKTRTDYISVYSTPVSACAVQTQDLSANVGMGIRNFSINTINNNTKNAQYDEGYKDFSCSIVTRLVRGMSYPVSIETGTILNNENTSVYIDYNNDGAFNETNERAFSSSNAGIYHSGIITIPQSAVSGALLRMRVMSDFYPLSSCTNPLYGQAEDYGVVLLADASANKPPAFLLGDSVSVVMSEDSSPTTFDLTLTAEEDDGETVTWSIKNQAFHGSAAVSGTGTSKTITYTPVLNYYGNDSFVIQVSDIHGGTDSITVNVTVASIGDTPTDILLSNNTVDEYAPTGTVVGSLSAIDNDMPDDSFVFTLINNDQYPDNSSFTIEGSLLKTTGIFYYNIKNSYEISVKVTDGYGLTYDKTFTVSVNDILPIQGDINGNGTVALDDLVIVFQILDGANPQSLINPEADVDGDGKLDIKEVIFILKANAVAH